jgi:hypothetical protein
VSEVELARFTVSTNGAMERVEAHAVPFVDAGRAISVYAHASAFLLIHDDGERLAELNARHRFRAEERYGLFAAFPDAVLRRRQPVKIIVDNTLPAHTVAIREDRP